MSDFSGEQVAEATLDDDYTKPRGWRHTTTWTYLVMLIASAVALVVSFVLSAETLKLARNPGQKLSCDVNAVMSCSAVAESWQAEVVKVAVPRWFALCTWLGGLAALAYSYWLTSQSLFVINALCPWCLCLMFSTTVQFMALSHATAVVQEIPAKREGVRTYYRLNYDLMVDALWIVTLIVIILVEDGPLLFS